MMLMGLGEERRRRRRLLLGAQGTSTGDKVFALLHGGILIAEFLIAEEMMMVIRGQEAVGKASLLVR